ncbi:MAG: hypothetical protein P4K83_04940 [Terracidiphilus sp.]|nr:hypothetical protein [Terracidiphilus sp.]
METELQNTVQIAWKQVAVEASHALSLLDAERLEDLAHSCRAFNRDLPDLLEKDPAAALLEARRATGAVATLAQVLEATRANLQVLYRLYRFQSDSDVYCSGKKPLWDLQESANGHN